jgi:hypothetical protein
MEQQFQLKHHGKLTLFEQNQMTSEERSWFLRRLEKEFQDRKNAEENQTKPNQSMPNRPSMPSKRK